MPENFSIKKFIKEAWEIWKRNKKTLTLATLVIAIIEIIQPDRLEGDNVLAYAFFVFLWVLHVIASIGLAKICLKLVSGEQASWREVFSYARLFWKVAGASILLFLGGVAGLILLVIPGIYFLLKYKFAVMFIIDKNLGIAEAFRESARITEGVKWKLLGLVIIMVGLNILGLLAFVVGILISMPITFLAYVRAYKTLSLESPTHVPAV